MQPIILISTLSATLLGVAGCSDAGGPVRLEPAPETTVWAGAGFGGPPLAVPTYHRDVAPILVEHCAECHHTGGIAPFPLTTYEEARPFASAIASSTADRTMPPFNLDNSGECNTFRDARWLTDVQIATLGAWVGGGAMEGDPADATAAVAPPLWSLDRVDLPLAMEEPYTPDPAAFDDYRCFVLDPGLTEDRFITGFQVRLGEPRMVHHLTLFALDSEEDDLEAEALDAAEPGPGYTCFGDTVVDSRWLVGSGPGDTGDLLPPGTGLRIEAGRKTVLQMHYNQANGNFSDRTTIDLKLEPSVPDEMFLVRVAATDLELPPGEPAVTAIDDLQAGGDARFWGVWPHMHNLGTALSVTATSPARDVCLARVDRWRFHWQGFSFYEEPVYLDDDDTLEITCTYDTTSRDTTTTWGSGTDDEMCIGFFYATSGWD